jgi:sugar phosphate isomerase/epimerase
VPEAGHPIGLAHLTLLDLSPAELVRVAHRAGYDFVGLRVLAVTEGEVRWDLAPGSDGLLDALAALADTGMTVRDVEFLVMDAHVGPAEWLPALEAGAALNAQVLITTGADAETARLTDNLGRLARDAADFGLTVVLEPISYQPVSTVAAAAVVARSAGAAVLVDTLHFVRAGSTLESLAALSAALVPMIQLCDGPLVMPTGFPVVDHLPGHMKADRDPRTAEARGFRESPGTGEFPLRQILDALPDDVPISLEVPDARLIGRVSPDALATRLRVDVEALLGSRS